MQFTMNKIAAVTVLATAAMSAQAAPQALLNTSNFVLLNFGGSFVGGTPAPFLTGFIDTAAGTWGVASTQGVKIYDIGPASPGKLYGPGTYTVSVIDSVFDPSPANVTFTVGAGQLGGSIKLGFKSGYTNGIIDSDVFNVWDVSTASGITTYTSTKFNNIFNGRELDPFLHFLGFSMVDGSFSGYSANFNLAVTAVPEASTYGMMLTGLGLVGFAVRRRKLMA